MSSIPSVVFLPPSFVTGQLTLQQAPPHRALCDVDKPSNPTQLHTFVNFWPFFAHETVTVIPSKLELAWKSKKRLRGGFEGSFIPRFFAGEGRKAKVAASRVSETRPRPKAASSLLQRRNVSTSERVPLAEREKKKKRAEERAIIIVPADVGRRTD